MISLCTFHMNVYQYLLIICNILFPGQIVRACTTVVHRIVNAHTALTSTAYVGVLQVICHKRSCLDNEFEGENKKLSSSPPHPASPPQCLEAWRRTVHSADSADGSEGCVAIIILTPTTMLFFVFQPSGCYSVIQWYSVTHPFV